MTNDRFAVGIIGLGPLGMAFAQLLMDQGEPVIGYRRSGMDEFLAAGGTAAASPADLVSRSEVVFDCLPHEDALLSLFGGDFSIMDTVSPGQVFASLTSHTLANMQRFAELVGAEGGVVLDCEVDGSPETVAQQKATIYVSGDSAAAARIAPLLDRISAHHSHVGSFGEATRKLQQAERSSPEAATPVSTGSAG